MSIAAVDDALSFTALVYTIPFCMRFCNGVNEKLQHNCNSNYILYSRLSWLGDYEGTFRSLSQAANCLPHTVVASLCPFNC